ncbi:trna (uracil-o-)-methyltransferase [Diplodia corticola]|uniref:tRNA (uracil-O(2)-)-methyltransferase n=1 Tax=Diplodia corticola TaxID=236234 RepID=A0A1J9R4S5_9PEZI|nr:trna (uracil-o-)-methyltransferase [Diplodia corticola]OJD35234.1 trna (uracil-o-)-methyltransferase [Diplodia corticola]
MGNTPETQVDATTVENGKKAFQPRDITHEPSTFSLPDESWTSMFETACAFEPEYYQRVMLNLIRHPEIASTYLFRAEIFYDSFNDPEGKFVKHIKADYQPLPCHVPGYQLEQTIVRRMIPRNPQRDNPLVQTCHVFQKRDDAGSVRNLVVYIPHAQSASEVPFYHPTVAALAFLHTWPSSHPTPNPSPNASPTTLGQFSIHYRLFPTHPLDNRLTRTALSLLTLINKHSLGQKAGYTKRVHHDQVIPQARFQDTYTRLKTVYAKNLIDGWVEQTPPGKHVFEDLGIAAFLLELWRDMYATPIANDASGAGKEKRESDEQHPAQSKDDKEAASIKPPFPGFVDIGCGNGVLVHVLRSEGYPGWGFDARRRKTWDTFPPAVRDDLKEMVLVPESFTRAAGAATSAAADAATTPLADLKLSDDNATAGAPASFFHNGIFPPGTFIISNHADELTPWTPLLAFLSCSPFIAIPCCSHNFAGAKFRAPVQKSASDRKEKEKAKEKREEERGGATGSLAAGNKKGNGGKNQQPSAYATLCDWVARLAEDVGFVPEKEMLRIPSTRNAGIIGRRRRGERRGDDEGETQLDDRLEVVRKLLVKEMGGNVDGAGGLEGVGREWVERAGKLVKGQGGGH